MREIFYVGGSYFSDNPVVAVGYRIMFPNKFVEQRILTGGNLKGRRPSDIVTKDKEMLNWYNKRLNNHTAKIVEINVDSVKIDVDGRIINMNTSVDDITIDTPITARVYIERQYPEYVENNSN